MKKIDIILRIVSGLYVYARRRISVLGSKLIPFVLEEPMTRQQVKEYLHISESTYKRKVKDGTLRPMRLPGGDRYYKSELVRQWRRHCKRRRRD